MCNLIRVFVLSVFVAGGLVGAASLRAEEHDRVRQMAAQGRILPLQSIAERARRDVEGRILEAELESGQDSYVYELEMLTPDGRIHKLYYDAVTGEPAPGDEEDNDN